MYDQEAGEGANIKMARRALGISQAELASMLGIDQSDISDYETGRKQLSTELSRRLWQLLSPKGS